MIAVKAIRERPAFWETGFFNPQAFQTYPPIEASDINATGVMPWKLLTGTKPVVKAPPGEAVSCHLPTVMGLPAVSTAPGCETIQPPASQTDARRKSVSI
jgi:hypothetical protein